MAFGGLFQLKQLYDSMLSHRDRQVPPEQHRGGNWIPPNVSFPETDVARQEVDGQNQCEPFCSLPWRMMFIPAKKTHGSCKQKPSLVFTCHSGNFIITSSAILPKDLACSSKASGKGEHFGKVPERVFFLSPYISEWQRGSLGSQDTLTPFYSLDWINISQQKNKAQK